MFLFMFVFVFVFVFFFSCQEPLDKISAKMPWNKNKQELKDMKMQREVLNVLTKAQRKKPETIRAGHRQAIADKAACVSVYGWISYRLFHDNVIIIVHCRLDPFGAPKSPLY